MMVSISEVGDVELLKPLHADEVLLVPVVTDDGQCFELRLNRESYRKIGQFLVALAALAAETPQSKPLGEPLH